MFLTSQYTGTGLLLAKVLFVCYDMNGTGGARMIKDFPKYANMVYNLDLKKEEHLKFFFKELQTSFDPKLPFGHRIVIQMIAQTKVNVDYLLGDEE